MVGDRLDTDIAWGKATGMGTQLVMTGEEAHPWVPIQPRSHWSPHPSMRTQARPDCSERAGWQAGRGAGGGVGARVRGRVGPCAGLCSSAGLTTPGVLMRVACRCGHGCLPQQPSQRGAAAAGLLDAVTG